jgi:superfamily II DNA or RNA helicase
MRGVASDVDLAPAGSPLQLRPYQTEAIERLRESYASAHRAPLFQLPTGGGKTVVFGAITRSAASRGKRVLIAVHRRELLGQACAKLTWAGVAHGIIAAGFPGDPREPVQVCSVQTAARRLSSIGDFDLLVLDEAHHARARTWARLIEALSGAKVLGVTATPARLDGKGLGVHCGGFFDDLVCGPGIAELVRAGHLSPTRYFVPTTGVDLGGVPIRGGDYVASEVAARVDKKAITGNAVDQYQQRAKHQPALAFCALVSHAEHVAEEFRSAGYSAACVHGGLSKDERDRLIAGLGTGEVEVLTSCDLISEGLDVPALGAVILLRPTASLVLHMQQIGRGMRPAAGKAHLVVLDHVGNIRRHGRPDFERIWTLDGSRRRLAQRHYESAPNAAARTPQVYVSARNAATSLKPVAVGKFRLRSRAGSASSTPIV